MGDLEEESHWGWVLDKGSAKRMMGKEEGVLGWGEGLCMKPYQYQ